MRKTKGFTLIELLVVVAIIGVLATIVLASLGNARTRAKDVAVVQAVSQYRTQVEIAFGGDYTYACDYGANDRLNEIKGYIESQGGGISQCASSANEYILTVVLPSGDVNQWTGLFGKTAYAADDAGYCVNAYGNSTPISLKKYNSLVEEIKQAAGDYKFPVTEKGENFAPFCTDQEASEFLGVPVGDYKGGDDGSTGGEESYRFDCENGQAVCYYGKEKYPIETCEEILETSAPKCEPSEGSYDWKCDDKGGLECVEGNTGNPTKQEFCIGQEEPKCEPKGSYSWACVKKGELTCIDENTGNPTKQEFCKGQKEPLC